MLTKHLLQHLRLCFKYALLLSFTGQATIIIRQSFYLFFLDNNCHRLNVTIISLNNINFALHFATSNLQQARRGLRVFLTATSSNVYNIWYP